MSQMPTTKPYRFKMDYEAVNRNKNVTDSYRFKKGEIVHGEDYKNPLSDTNVFGTANVRMMPMVVIHGKYLIPSHILEALPIELSQFRVEHGAPETASKAPSIRNKMILGAVIGGGYAWINNKSMFKCAMFGVVAGALLGFYLKTKDEKKKPVNNPLHKASPLFVTPVQKGRKKPESLTAQRAASASQDRNPNERTRRPSNRVTARPIMN